MLTAHEALMEASEMMLAQGEEKSQMEKDLKTAKNEAR